MAKPDNTRHPTGTAWPVADSKRAAIGSPRRATRSAMTRNQILESATRLFLDEGYSQTSIEQIAENAGTTKPTVYSHFGSKRALFDAVVQQNADQRVSLLTDPLTPTDNPQQDLIDFGDIFLSVVLSPQAQRWDRLAAAESLTSPEVGEAFYRAGPARVLRHLAEYIRQQHKAGRMMVVRASAAAEQLLGLLLGLDLLRTQIGQPPPSRAMLKKRCRESVAVFLAAYGVDDE